MQILFRPLYERRGASGAVTQKQNESESTGLPLRDGGDAGSRGQNKHRRDCTQCVRTRRRVYDKLTRTVEVEIASSTLLQTLNVACYVLQ